MEKPDLVRQIIKSPEAKTFLKMVTRGFYNESALALWIFEVIGREWDEMRAWSEGLKDEIHPQTCTWSIAIWEWVYGIEPDESLTLEERRKRIMARICSVRPINPEAIRRSIAELIGIDKEDVSVNDFVAPYTFEVIIHIQGGPVQDKIVLRHIRTIKPSHLALKINEDAKRVFRLEVPFLFASIVGTELKGEPVEPMRELETDLALSYGAYGRTHAWAEPVPPKQTTTHEASHSGGLYCRTHIKTKPIKEA